MKSRAMMHSPSIARQKFGTAHLATGIVAVGGLIALPFLWPAALERGDLANLETASEIACGSTVLYLLVTAVFELRLGLSLGRLAGLLPWPGVYLIASHALVLVASLVALWRGPDSLALLAGLDGLLAFLATLGSLALLVSTGNLWFGRKSPRTVEPPPAKTDRSPISTGLLVVQLAACLLVAATLLFLEFLPPPAVEGPHLAPPPNKMVLHGEWADARGRHKMGLLPVAQQTVFASFPQR